MGRASEERHSGPTRDNLTVQPDEALPRTDIMGPRTPPAPKRPLPPHHIHGTCSLVLPRPNSVAGTSNLSPVIVRLKRKCWACDMLGNVLIHYPVEDATQYAIRSQKKLISAERLEITACHFHTSIFGCTKQTIYNVLINERVSVLLKLSLCCRWSRLMRVSVRQLWPVWLTNDLAEWQIDWIDCWRFPTFQLVQWNHNLQDLCNKEQNFPARRAGALLTAEAGCTLWAVPVKCPGRPPVVIKIPLLPLQSRSLLVHKALFLLLDVSSFVVEAKEEIP